MTPKEKAQELFSKYYNAIENSTKYNMYKSAKQCALIAVNEILKDRERLCDAFFYDGNYWLKVKKQIEKL